ncbi:glycerophosphodiester phosphodiesterase [Halorussus marinus]|uniref:glycerophosphodiester phosphodiesterase n=1 Tax=Halorussus marinus TaxID=2505976 RepID=UPI00106E467C|nr:glycerophosphodiester phosphodiesterase [Halorussus marinus]
MLGKIQELSRRTFLKVTGASLVGGAASATSGADESTDAERRPPTQGGADAASLVAHRGFAGLYPENTLGAIRGSVAGQSPPTADRVKADMIEIDIMPSADGDVMVFHDDTLGRLTDAPERMADQYVWETPTDRLRELRVLGTDEPIPRLGEAMRAIPSEVGVNIEFKNPGSADIRFAENLDGEALETQTELWMDLAEDALAIAADHDNEVLVSSFQEGALAAVREVDDGVPIAFLFWDSIEEGLAITEEYDCEALHPPRNMIRGTDFFGNEYYDGQEPETFADVDLIAEAHDAGRAVNVWTVQTWRQAEQLQEAGVDGLIADYDGLQRYGAGAV